ncbi:hypothetical protein GPECTOR_25g433 [Gonium pectorale]|uniref:EF-hand domain-containing protein n=1 Tax=Gonium pectorale TaxID=33097 RepID=A0A150GG84_GONPE|nr:hypothetical protein GPECTOR_25g433 [Gonium pectorale]|eukprot:KXZ48848.1 hypothetical protein GPECTOR_25g433 [Gonium pectorale]
MAESLGGSRGRNEGVGGTKNVGLGRTQGPGRNGGGGILDRPATAREARDGRLNRTGAIKAVLGGGGGSSVPRQRPSSAPRERGGPLSAQVRVEENRRIKEADFWGREADLRANKPDLPAFWSVRTHGQSYHDERLAAGASNFYRLAAPPGLNASAQRDPVASALGPATLQQAALRKSLETGRRHFTSLADLAPLPHGAEASQPLSDADREFLLSRLTPYQRIHALHQCLDKDATMVCKEWIPWPLSILNRDTLNAEREGRKPRPPKYDIRDWNGGAAQRDMLMRLATGELEYMMRRHLKYMSDQTCGAARAPAAMEKDILRQAFWRVDPNKTGTVSIQQFLQARTPAWRKGRGGREGQAINPGVWQNILRLLEYVDTWVKGKDIKGKMKYHQVLKPLRTVLLDRNMAAALFVKYGFDKDGLLPYVVFINALCETPSRLLGHEVVLDKKSRGKNGLEDELDIAMCLGNAKIEYRYCASGVFPPADFSGQMGKRSFYPPKAHMWLEHVYGYAGMLEYTRQSNLFYTHNTGKPLRPENERAVRKALLAAQGADDKTQLRPEQAMRVEFVYYTGSVGVVLDKERFDAGLPCQRFFFGHSNDIQCLTIHPNRKWVATGQQKCTGDKEVPYACIWDVDTCQQLQRLDHDRDERGVIALCFSGSQHEGKGGELLLTVTSDDKHTIHVWRWLPHSDKYINAHYIPGWCLGPEKKMTPQMKQEMFYTGGGPYSIVEGETLDDSWLGRYPFDFDNWQAACSNPKHKQGQTHHGKEHEAVQAILRASREQLNLEAPAWEARADWWNQDPLPSPFPGCEPGPCPMWSHLEDPELRVRSEDADGLYFNLRRVKREDGFFQPGSDDEKRRLPHLEQTMLGRNGTPPMVYGLVWNPLKPSDGRRGSEFASYGVKHLKVWIADDDGRFIGTSGSFKAAHIENVLSAVYVPAMHALRSPGDSCILTGFASGRLGLWVPPYPTRVGAVYSLVRHFDAHGPGKPIALNDGTQCYGGVRALKLNKRKDGTLEVLSGGADGCVRRWVVQDVSGSRPDGAPVKGVNLARSPDESEREYKLMMAGTGLKREEPPMVVSLDAHDALDKEFIAGTDGCDIWEVDADPRVLVEGHEAPLDEVACHPEDPDTFGTACTSGKLRVWNARRRDVVMCADLGYKLSGIAYSQEQLAIRRHTHILAHNRNGTRTDPRGAQNEAGAVIYEGYHLAVSGERGELTVMRSDNLQPLVHRHDVISRQASTQTGEGGWGGRGEAGRGYVAIPELKYSPFGGPKMLAAAAADLTVYIYRADRNYQLLAK